MPYVYQTARAELHDQIARHRAAVHGRVLDVGAGSFSRYRGLFDYESYTRMDVGAGDTIDIVGRAERLPFPNGSFETIVCTQVIGDVYEGSQVFEEFYRVLALGGTILLTESFMDPLHAEPNDFWRFTEHSMRRLAEDAGFVVEALERRGGYHSVMAQFKNRYWIDRLKPYERWYRRFYSGVAKLHGFLARWRDRHDHSVASKRFTHGYLLVARKYA